LDRQSRAAIQAFEQEIRKKYGQDVWIQPNIVNFTLFPIRTELNEILFNFFKGYVNEHKQQFAEFKIYEHVDAIELVHKAVDKGLALKQIMHFEKLLREDVVAVGDSASDAPMFKEVEYSFGIGFDEARYRVDNIDDAIEKIKKLLSL